MGRSFIFEEPLHCTKGFLTFTGRGFRSGKGALGFRTSNNLFLYTGVWDKGIILNI